jgi:hypothetical protein
VNFLLIVSKTKKRFKEIEETEKTLLKNSLKTKRVLNEDHLLVIRVLNFAKNERHIHRRINKCNLSFIRSYQQPLKNVVKKRR